MIFYSDAIVFIIKTINSNTVTHQSIQKSVRILNFLPERDSKTSSKKQRLKKFESVFGIQRKYSTGINFFKQV